MSSPQRLALWLLTACAPTQTQPRAPAEEVARPAPAPAPAAAPIVTVDSGDPEAPTVAVIDPEVLDLLTAHRRDPPAEAEANPTIASDDAPPRCHPERPDTPRERSRCLCERACARTIDRPRLARQLLAAGGDPETIQRWLDERRPSEVHYPLFEIDGTRIEFDGDGVITRCRHYAAHVPESAVDVRCDELPRASADGARPEPPEPPSGS